MGRVVYSDAYAVVREEALGRFLRWERLPSPIESISEFRKHGHVFKRLAEEFPSHGLLLDMRAASLRNDPAFSAVANEVARELKAFRRVAVLIRSAVGMLQATRLQKHRERVNPVFDSEEAAVDYLTSTD